MLDRPGWAALSSIRLFSVSVLTESCSRSLWRCVNHPRYRCFQPPCRWVAEMGQIHRHRHYPTLRVYSMVQVASHQVEREAEQVPSLVYASLLLTGLENALRRSLLWLHAPFLPLAFSFAWPVDVVAALGLCPTWFRSCFVATGPWKEMGASSFKSGLVTALRRGSAKPQVWSCI